MQRRWVAGSVVIAGFSASFAAFLFCALKILFQFYSVWLDFDAFQGGEVSVRGVIVFLLLGLFIYLFSLVDVYSGYMRACSEWAAKKAGVSGSVGR